MQKRRRFCRAADSQRTGGGKGSGDGSWILLQTLAPNSPHRRLSGHPCAAASDETDALHLRPHLPRLPLPFREEGFPLPPAEEPDDDPTGMLICPSWISCRASAGRWLICCCVSR